MNHIAIIMDGNRRFAKKLNKPASYGHKYGAETIKLVCKYAKNFKIPFITLFAFSTENWNRDVEEINSLNNLLKVFLSNESKHFIENKIKVLVIGDMEPYSDAIKAKINDLVNCTKDFTGFTLCIALNYGGKQDILNATNSLLREKKDSVSLEDFETHLYVSELPEVDLLIRTGGSRRISNFILWKLAYTELYFTDVLWPEFKEENFINAINFFKTQQRNFGF